MIRLQSYRYLKNQTKGKNSFQDDRIWWNLLLDICILHRLVKMLLFYLWLLKVFVVALGIKKMSNSVKSNFWFRWAVNHLTCFIHRVKCNICLHINQRLRCHSMSFQLFHDVEFFLLGLILFCYNQLFERKSKIDFPDFSIFRFFTSHIYSFIKYEKILGFSIFLKKS